jgi:hypothetical protein
MGKSDFRGIILERSERKVLDIFWGIEKKGVSNYMSGASNFEILEKSIGFMHIFTFS